MNPPVPPPISHARSWAFIALGVATIIAGVIITLTTFGTDEASGTEYITAFGPILVGVGTLMYGVSGIAGYRSFVAWRYLLVATRKVSVRTKVIVFVALLAQLIARGAASVSAVTISKEPWAPASLVFFAASLVFLVTIYVGVLRHSRPAAWVFMIGMGLGLVAQVVVRLMLAGHLPFVGGLPIEIQGNIALIVSIAGLIGFALAGLAAFFGTLRAFFTFFTTVPIGGVWIGTAALVCVLSVMSGFETDLREKILGSNAHIQITREEGEFVDWRAAKARIDRIPGVVASTPYAVSEVVIAAHNNGMNVIIKGIDPETVAKVTDLVSDLEDKNAIKDLEPLVEERKDLEVPQQPRDDNALDPAPDDLPSAGEPIDFSSTTPSKPARDDRAQFDAFERDLAKRLADADSAPVGANELPPTGTTEPFGGDAKDLQAEVLDPAPPDLAATDAPPQDYSAEARQRDPDSLPIEVVDFPESTISRRTRSLPGVLVGRELVKQTHLYTGEEVRIVSPLSDPSNPDATGTPIPFNRDYRVAGVFFTGMYEYDLKYVYVTLESLQDFLDRGDSIDGIEVRITDADDTERFVGVLGRELGPGYRIIDWRELNRSLFSALKLEKIAMFLVLGIVILVASFSIVGNLIMVVVEKAREIALLKTLGASNFGVMQLFAIQGLMIGLIGTALGIATGLLACWAGRKFGLPLNPDVYYIDRLPIHVDPQSVASAAAAGILISIAATLYPALLAARVRPAAGMRH